MRLNPHTIKYVVDIALLAAFIYVLSVSTDCVAGSMGSYMRASWVAENRSLWLKSILAASFVVASSFTYSYVTDARKRRAPIIEYAPLVVVLSVSVLFILPFWLFGGGCLNLNLK